MITKPIDDFKGKRRDLSSELQVHVDNIVARMQNISLYLCELSPQYQSIDINLDTSKRIRFIIHNTKKILYIMFI